MTFRHGTRKPSRHHLSMKSSAEGDVVLAGARELQVLRPAFEVSGHRLGLDLAQRRH